MLKKRREDAETDQEEDSEPRRTAPSTWLEVPNGENHGEAARGASGSASGYHRVLGGRMAPARRTTMKTPVPDKGGGVQKGERQSVQVIARAASILRALERNPEGLSLGEIAKLVDLSRSTVQRIVDALDREQLVLASSMGRGVRLGPALLRLAGATRFEIGEMARDTMEALSKETGETVDLSVLDNEKIVFVHQVVGSHLLRAVSAVGEAFPLHCTSPGKAFLASLDDVKLAKLRKKMKLTRFTPNTIVTWSGLDRELEKVRQTGIGVDREELTLGISAVAVVLRGPTGDLAALSLPVPTQRFETNEAEVTRALVAHGRDLQERLRR